MNYVIGIINSKYYKAYYKIVIILLAIRGFVDFVLYFFTKSVDPVWQYVWIFALVFALLANTTFVEDNIQSVQKYYMNKLQGDLYDKYIGVTKKDWNSKKNEFLFAVADGLHQGLPFTKIKKYIRKLSHGYCTLCLKKGKNIKKDDFDLILMGKNTKPKKIIYSKDKSALSEIARRKIESSVDKYLDESSENNGKQLLRSVLFALKWKSIDSINSQIYFQTHPIPIDRDIVVKTYHEIKEYTEFVNLQLFDGGKKITYIEIYDKGHYM